MLIGIDGNEANTQSRVGVGQFAFHIINWLHRIDTTNQYIIYLKQPPLSDFPPSSLRWQYRVFGPSKLWTKIALPLHLYTQKEKLNLFYSPSHYTPSFSPFPLIPTIHDLGYLQFRDQFTSKDLYQLVNWTKSSIKRSKHIITVSQFSKDELQRIYQVPENKITIAHNGVGEPPSTTSEDTSQTLSKFKIKKPYFLYLGTLKPNKNIPLLIEAFSLFLKNQKKPSKHQLVIAGKKGWLYNDIFTTVTKLGLKKHIIFTDFITEAEKWALYRQALCFVIPSTYEGFGIPALEAMKVGTPVIASSIPPLIEVVADSGLLFDPSSSKDLADKMTQISTGNIAQKFSKQGPGQAAKFTWENSAKSIISVFQSFG